MHFLDLKHGWFIGGAGIYKDALDIATEMWITQVPGKVDGDNLVYFPKFDERNWKCTACLFTEIPDLNFLQFKQKK